MKRAFYIGSFILSSFPFLLSGQDTIPVVHFKSGDKILSENLESFIEESKTKSAEHIDGYYYHYVQFDKIPDLEKQKALKASGLKIIEYIPDYTYLVAFPEDYDVNLLRAYRVRSVVREDVEDKIDQRFLTRTWPSWAEEGTQIKVIIKAYPLTTRETFVSLLRQEGIYPKKNDIRFPYVFTTLTESEILAVAELSFVQYIDLGPAPAIPEDTGGKTLQRANLINSGLSGGLEYDGAGVNIMVRDDGFVGPHIDFKGRIVDYTFGVDNGFNHSDGVAGVFCGAGNLDPTIAGAASGAKLFITNYDETFTDNTVALHQSDNVVITNSSYGDGCNDGYTIITQHVDQQMIDNSSLMHVFSCGNSGLANCNYGAGGGWGTITGGHKLGKNVIAVANLNAEGIRHNSSSRGPATDGRIKPDISAHGQWQMSTEINNQYKSFGGTSSAAPTMAGSLAQLYQAYRELNGGSDPNAGFMKAVVLNTAKDLGNIGPDFKFGWGRIDAYQAYQTLVQGSYSSNSLSQGETNTHSIVVPADVSELRIMVYWTDPAASLSANKDLVNDLDTYVNDPSSTRFNPWELDPTPDPVILDLPATKGKDALNNMEQVAINSPAAGTYELNVEGSTVPMGSQEYFVVWSFFYDETMVTYPNGGEGFVPGEIERIHWDATGSVGTFDIEYSTNNGSNWNMIASGVTGDSRTYGWLVPSVVSGQVLVKVTRDNQSDQSDHNFSIIDLPSSLSISASCKTGVTLNWNAVSGADKYVIYLLGDKYMEAVDTVTVLSYQFNNLISDETAWFSIQAINDIGAIGRRANAISYFIDSSDPPCRNTISFEKSVSSIDANAGDTLQYTLSLTNHYDVPITGIEIIDQLNPNWTFVNNSLTCGNLIGGIISISESSLASDQSISCSFKVMSDTDSYTYIIFEDDLESGNGNWSVNNTTGEDTWTINSTNSKSPSNSWFTPNTGTDNTQVIESIPILIAENIELSFFHDFATEFEWDGGMVEISVDGGTSWTDLGPMMIQNGYNGTLGASSNPDIHYRNAFTGDSDGYLQTIADLSSFSNTWVKIRFIFGSDNNTFDVGWFVDDIVLRNAYYQINTASIIYDQGAEVTSFVKTLIMPCINDCPTCIDGIQNGQETGVDCGGSCAPCPCTQEGGISFDNMTFPDPTLERTNQKIESLGIVNSMTNATIDLFSGSQFNILGQFEISANAEFSISIELCDEN